MLQPQHMTKSDIMRLVAQTQFREFTKEDWYAFAGCDSSNPLIAEIDDWTVLIDGETISISRYNDDFTVEDYNYKLSQW